MKKYIGLFCMGFALTMLLCACSSSDYVEEIITAIAEKAETSAADSSTTQETSPQETFCEETIAESESPQEEKVTVTPEATESSRTEAAANTPKATSETTRSSQSTPAAPGPDVVELVNLRGDTTTVYKLVDGTYMDRIDRKFTYNGKDAWIDQNGAEWNEKVVSNQSNNSYPGPDVVELVNLRGDTTTAYKLVDGTYMDRIDRKYTYNGKDTWIDENGAEWNEAVASNQTNNSRPGPDVVELVNLRGDTTTAYKLIDGTYMDRIDRKFTYNGTDTWKDEDGVEWNEIVP